MIDSQVEGSLFDLHCPYLPPKKLLEITSSLLTDSILKRYCLSLYHFSVGVNSYKVITVATLPLKVRNL